VVGFFDDRLLIGNSLRRNLASEQGGILPWADHLENGRGLAFLDFRDLVEPAVGRSDSDPPGWGRGEVLVLEDLVALER